MKIKQLELCDFRNYETLSVEFDDKVNILYGDNAQGKTNVLEAVYLCSTTKSYKGNKDRDMIRHFRDEAHIRMTIEKAGIGHRIDMHLKKTKAKGVAVDGVPIKRSSDLFGLIHVVFFSPEDLSMIKNGPMERRRFLDLELCQLDKSYLFYLTRYNKALNQRNNLLKQISFQREMSDTIDVWNAQLLEYGIGIIRTRENFIREINEILPEMNERLSGGKERLLLRYEPNVSESEFEEKLIRNFERDLVLKSTGYGPHRDDFVFHIENENIRLYGSQGQQRTAALSLKLTELELVSKKIKEPPVLLLDDVLSELDRNRQNYLLESITQMQTILTCTGLEELIGGKKEYHKIFHVVNGTVNREF